VARRNAKKILVILSEYGYWGEELVGPLHHFDQRGYEVVFATPTGRQPHALPPSMDPTYIDPPLGKSVTSEEVAKLTRQIDESDRLADPIDISGWVPERPYTADEDYLRRLEAYHRAVDLVAQELEEYDALLIVGGSGPIVDLANNERVHQIILSFVSP
jgi:putative intracellular protease/amidase